MNIRPKTARRLAVLFAGFAIFACGVALLLMRSVRKEKAAVAAMRDAAFKAYDRHDNATAVTLFGGYLNSGPAEGNDAEAVFAYGMARSQVPMEGNRHMAEAINLLQKYLELAPTDPHDASHQLLWLYSRARYNKEASTLAARLLAKNPRDIEALRAETVALINDREFASALSTCQKLNQIDPTSVVWQERQLQLMSELHQPADQILAHARQLVDAHPDDPRFHLVMAGAYELSGDRIKAQQEVETAAKLPPSDATTALHIIAMLGHGPHSSLADDLLDRAQAKFKDRALEELSIRRLFEREQYADLVARLKALDPKSAAVSTDILAYDAIAHYRLGHRTEGDAIVMGIAQRSDPPTKAWAQAIRTRFAEPAIAPVAAIKAYGEAITQDHNNAVFPFYLGETRAELGETDEAIRDWNTAARLSPFWAEPVYRVSRTLSAEGRYTEALMAAEVLAHRAPNALETQVAIVIASWGRIQNNPAELQGKEGAKLIEAFKRIRAIVPQEPDTLPAYVALLSRRGEPDRAIGIVRSAMHALAPLPETTFEHLLPISQQEHWNIEAEILDAAEKAHGLTPSIGYDRAISLFRAGKQTEAIKVADGYRAAHPTDVAWLLDDARFRDAVGQPGAINRWKSLCDAHPDDIRVQYAALSAPCRFTDRSFWQHIIERVKDLAGADGEAWQIEQARFTLAGNPSPEQLPPIIESLQKLSEASPELGEVHHLLGTALLMDKKPDELPKAVTELTTAHQEQPNDFQTTSELASLLIAQGRRDDAAAIVDAVSRDAQLDEPQRLWAAQTEGELGNFDLAIKLLAPSDGQVSSPNRDPLLAGLYLRAGRLDEARSLYTRISNDPAATIQELLDAAEFFATARDTDSADQCVDRLKGMKLAPGSLELLQSRLQELEDHRDAAAKILADACRANSQNPQLWQAWAGLILRSGKLEEADKIAAAGLGAIPADPGLAAMRARIAQLRSINLADASDLLDPVSRDPRQPALDQVLAVLDDAVSRRQSAQQTAAALRPVTDRYPRFFALQQILVRTYFAINDARDANDIASRAADLLPGDPKPLKLLTELKLAQGDWESAGAAALRWHQCTLANPLEADLEIARIDLGQPNADPGSALKQLEPYMPDSAREAQKLAAMPLYCQALVVSGRIDDAARLLQPLVGKSPRWARLWMDLARSAKDGQTASEWLKKLAPLLAADSPAEQIALADAWERVGSRFEWSAAFDSARDILRPIIGGEKAPAAAWQVWALANQMAGDLPEAEHAWQKTLDIQPADPSTRNNLAYVLLLEGGSANLARAEPLARQAITANPNAATFYDTLARVEAQLGKPIEAIHNFRVALEKDPDDVEAMIGLADILQSQPSSRAEARSLLSRINAILDAGAPLMEPVRKQLEHVKTALSASVSPGE